MIQIEKKYHFYAGHRNKSAGIKCARPHGHTYEIVIAFEFQMSDMSNGITMLFSDLDEKVEPIIKEYDHQFLLQEGDPLIDPFRYLNEEFKIMPFETSAENLAIFLFHRIKNEANLPIVRIELAETKSSKIIYTDVSS